MIDISWTHTVLDKDMQFGFIRDSSSELNLPSQWVDEDCNNYRGQNGKPKKNTS